MYNIGENREEITWNTPEKQQKNAMGKKKGKKYEEKC